jgi:hypothetical protein
LVTDIVPETRYVNAEKPHVEGTGAEKSLRVTARIKAGTGVVLDGD